jgi:hypothetical protein
LLKVAYYSKICYDSSFSSVLSAANTASESTNITDNLGDLGIDGGIILKRILNKRTGGCELDSSGSRYSSVVGLCEHDNIPSGFIKGVDFLGNLS